MEVNDYVRGWLAGRDAAVATCRDRWRAYDQDDGQEAVLAGEAESCALAILDLVPAPGVGSETPSLPIWHASGASATK